MTMFSISRPAARDWLHGHVTPVVLGATLTIGAAALVAYLLWPTWELEGSSMPERLPVSVGGTLFNLPIAAIRMKIQRHSGAQERVDLSFTYPALEPPGPQPHVSSSETLEELTHTTDRIFLSIAAHNDSLAPDMRVRTIYPRYLEQASSPSQDGLTMRAFRDGTPYSGEDLFLANTPALTARCTRDGETTGMCLSERRIDGANLTFRFPKAWLSQWQEVANAMDRLMLQLHGTK
jgi:hypothetical protein